MKTVTNLLAGSDREIVSVEPESFVYDALQLMAKNDIGCVLVIDDNKLVGIMSERDYARKVVLKGRSSWKTELRDVMRSEFPVVATDTPLEHCMALFSEYKVRYLPVVDKAKVVGLISIHDVIRELMMEQTEKIEMLNNYIYNCR